MRATQVEVTDNGVLVHLREPEAEKPAPRRARQRRTGWTRVRGIRETKFVGFVHEASGWTVIHCGHPTANWPWYAQDPAHPGVAVMTHNGKGWRHIDRALQAVEDVLAGKARSTNERCAGGVRRVIYPHEEDAKR